MWRNLDLQFLSSRWFQPQRGEGRLEALQCVSLFRQTQQGNRGVTWSVTHNPQVKTLKFLVTIWENIIS